jgi:hypothetical protein
MDPIRLLLLALSFSIPVLVAQSPLWSQIDQPRLIPDSTSDQVREYERILSGVYPNLGTGETCCEDLMEQLSALGLPIGLDSSAAAGDITGRTVIELPLREWSLYDRLLEGLKLHNATLAFIRERPFIVSLDSAEDPDYFYQVTYDISVFPIRFDSELDVEPVIDVVKSTVNPHDWDDTNGDQSIVLIFAGGHTLLVVHSTINTHLKIRRLFNSIVGLSGYSPVKLRPQLGAGQLSQLRIPTSAQNQFSTEVTQLSSAGLASSSVALPQRKRKAGITLPNSRDDNYGGFGGGGIFSISK